MTNEIEKVLIYYLRKSSHRATKSDRVSPTIGLRAQPALGDKAQNDERLGLLLAQWEFDKRLLSQALQNVKRTFPHYSIHDGSHAETILEQIARVLGDERLRKLSATDLWLLLESAYHHDIGMIIPAEEAQKAWEDPKFKEFARRVRLLSPKIRLQPKRNTPLSLPRSRRSIRVP
jgi:hypothetical protein